MAAFADAFYAPERAALVLIGDFSDEKGWQLLTSALPEEWREVRPDCPSATVHTIEEPAAQSSWPTRTVGIDEPTGLFGWSMPLGRTELRYAEYLASVVSRRLDNGSCWADGRELATVIACSSEGERSLPKARITRMSRDIADARSDAGHLLHVIHRYYALSEREYVSTSYERVGVSSTGLLASLARDLLQTGSMHWSARPSPDRFPASPALQWGWSWLDVERVRGVQLVPPDVPSAASSEAHAPRLPSTLSGVVPSDDQIRDMLAWPSFEGFHTAVLKNGTRVSFLPHDGPPTVVFEARHDGALDPWLWAGTEDWLDSLWSSLDAGDRSAAFRAHTIPRMHTTSRGLRIESIAGEPEVAISTIGYGLRDGVPIVEKREAAQTRAEYEASRAEAIADPDVVAYAAVWSKLAGGHPHPWLDDEGFARVTAVDRPDASRLLNSIAKPGTGHLVVVGGQDPWEDVLAYAKGALEKRRAWGKPTDAEIVPPARPPSPTAASVQVVPSELSKAKVYVACRIEEGSSAQRELLEVHLRDRLNESLRERLALTYGVSVWRSRTWLGELLWIESAVPAEQAGLTLSRILTSVDEVAGGEMDETQLRRLKATVARQTALEYQAPDDFADLILAVVGRESAADAPSFGSSLLAVTPESLGESLGQCVGRTQTAIVGDAEAIEASLAEAGIATTD